MAITYDDKGDRVSVPPTKEQLKTEALIEVVGTVTAKRIFALIQDIADRLTSGRLALRDDFGVDASIVTELNLTEWALDDLASVLGTRLVWKGWRDAEDEEDVDELEADARELLDDARRELASEDYDRSS